MEPCTESEFAAEVLRFTVRGDWASHRIGRRRVDYFSAGRRVLIMAVVGGKVCHYRVPSEPGPVAPFPSGCSYK